MSTAFLGPAPESDGSREMYADDVAEMGFVMNVSRLWAHRPDLVEGLFALLRTAVSGLGLDLRARAVLVTACASTMGDSYCSLAWGDKLAGASDPATAAGVVRGTDTGLSPVELELARWARALASNPNGVTAADVQRLRDAGFDDAAILAVTTFVALRLAFSTVNDALGARPDTELARRVPAALRAAVGFGRPVADEVPDRP